MKDQSLTERVTSFIRENDLLRSGDRVVAGVSGGADSVCLLYLLVSLRPEMDLVLRAVHVHHGLRGAEADRDAAFVERLCAGWEVPCRVVRVDAAGWAKAEGRSIEEAGRILRYRALSEEAERLGGAKIAVGHQKEDQAETILHNLFRGSALRGLAGMAPVSGRIIRPLLCAGREEIRGYLNSLGIGCCEDSTNRSDGYTRNRIRGLLPQICREVNSGAVDHILAAGERIAQADAYFEKEAERIWKESGTEEAYRCGVDADLLGGLPEILAGYLIMHMIRLRTGSVRDIGSVHVEQIRTLAEKGTGRQVSLPGGLRAVREYGRIWLEGERQTGVPGGIPCGCGPTDCALTFSQFPREETQKIPQDRYTKWFDHDKIKGGLSLRTRQTGDYITIRGGGRKSLKSFLIDEKVPRRQRDQIPLLAEGSHVLWIIGYRISEYYKVTETTKEILQVQAYRGEEHGGEDSGIDPGGRSEQEDR